MASNNVKLSTYLANEVVWGRVTDKPATATRWPAWSEVTSKPAATGDSTTPVYWSGSGFTNCYPFLRYLNSTDATTWTVDALAATDSIAFMRASVTGAHTTGHIVFLNAKTIGTPFQIAIHDSSELYIWKRYWISADSVYSAWTKMNAGYADSAGSVTWGNVTGKPSTFTPSSHTHDYLPLSGGTITGNLTCKTTYDASLANNGVSSTQYPTTFNITDKSDRIMTRLEGVIQSNGAIRGYWYIRNYNTSGSQVAQKGIYMEMDKSGNLTYNVSDAANFRSAIGVGASGTHADSYFALASHTHSYLPLSGGTMTGVLTLQGSQYGSNYAMNANNSNIIGVNDLRFADNAEAYDEGIMFYRDGSAWDCMAASGGTFYFRSGTDGTPSLSVANSNATIACGNIKIQTLSNNSSATAVMTFSSNNSANGLTYTNTSQLSVGLASKLTNITSSDAASSSATKRYVWFAYDDNKTGRPAYTTNLTYQTSTNTLYTYHIWLAGTTSATMTAGSTNPKITFAEGSTTQPVHLTYTDYDSYRSPAGLKVVGGDSATPAWFEAEGHIYAAAVHSAVWNDYAECRKSNISDPGRVIVPDDSGMSFETTKRLMAGCRVISDTWGMLIGESEESKTPVAICGRVLAYPYQAIENYHAGDCVCSAPNGTVDIMTRDEIKEWPDRIIGVVNEIPDYEIWTQTEPDGEKRTKQIAVNGRIWIDVR